MLHNGVQLCISDHIKLSTHLTTPLHLNTEIDFYLSDEEEFDCLQAVKHRRLECNTQISELPELPPPFQLDPLQSPISDSSSISPLQFQSTSLPSSPFALQSQSQQPSSPIFDTGLESPISLSSLTLSPLQSPSISLQPSSPTFDTSLISPSSLTLSPLQSPSSSLFLLTSEQLSPGLDSPTLSPTSSLSSQLPITLSSFASPTLSATPSDHVSSRTCPKLFDQKVYAGAAITTQQSWNAIMEYAITNNLSYSGIESLLDLMKLHCSIINNLPSSLYKLKKFYEDQHSHFTRQQYCSGCDEEVQLREVCTKRVCKQKKEEHFISGRINTYKQFKAYDNVIIK